MAVTRFYGATALTGGTEGALDSIDGNDLADKDFAIANDQTTVYFYVLDDDSGLAENSPSVIAPDTNPGTKRWILQSARFDDIVIVDDIVLVGDDVTVSGKLEIIGEAQIGDADGTGANLTIYSDTAGDTVVFDKTAKTLTLTDIQLAPTNISAFTLDGKLTAGATEIEGSNFDINGGNIDGTAIGAATPSTIVGTTIDANTDFTVGGTVITDGNIQDDGTFVIDAASAFQLQENNVTLIESLGFSDLRLSYGDIAMGTQGTRRGTLQIYGNATASDEGGLVSIHTADDHDTTIPTYSIQANQDDLLFGPSTNTDALKYNGGTNVWELSASGGFKLGTGATVTTILDEDNMTSDSATALATQQSIKAYSDLHIPDSLGTTKGDIIAFTGSSTPIRLGVGTDTHVLTADSAEASGIKWAAASGGGGDWTYTAQVATTSGTAVELSAAIPSSAVEIELIVNAISTNANDTGAILQLGDSGGYETSGYESIAGVIGATAAGEQGFSDGISLCRDVNQDAALTLTGTVVLTRWDSAEHLWIARGTLVVGNDDLVIISGSKTLTAALDRLRLTTSAGTATFDAGEARVRYR